MVESEEPLERVEAGDATLETTEAVLDAALIELAEDAIVAVGPKLDRLDDGMLVANELVDALVGLLKIEDPLEIEIEDALKTIEAVLDDALLDPAETAIAADETEEVATLPIDEGVVLV